MGVVAYKITSSKKLKEGYGWIFFIISLLGYSLYRMNDGQQCVLRYVVSILGVDLYESLSWSKYFISSYIIGLFVSLNFIGFAAISHRFNQLLEIFKKPIRYMASYTFILYLMHYPLLHFFSALTYDDITEKTDPLIVVLGSLLTIWLLGSVTEKQKNNYKKLFVKLTQRFKKKNS